jgi:hypothetical protein
MAWPDTVLAGETIRDAGAQRRRLNPYYGKGTGARLRLAPPGMLRPIFLAVPEQKNAQNQWHLDIQATTTTEAEVTRPASLGPTVLRQGGPGRRGVQGDDRRLVMCKSVCFSLGAVDATAAAT